MKKQCVKATLADVRRALAQQEIGAAFQPIVHLHTGRTTGCEVLARWNHPELGPCLPENFIALADRHGLIDALTEQVFAHALALAGSVDAAISFALNLTPTQLVDPDMPQRLSRQAGAAGFPMDRLTIELTETVLLKNLAAARRSAEQWKGLGCRLALDDFGNGYLNYKHLQALPFDLLKIDRDMIATMQTERGRHVVNSIIDLCHKLGLPVVAEGVEEQVQADLLLWLSCDFVQGWLFGRPLPADKLAEELADRETQAAALPKPQNRLEPRNFQDHLAQLQAIYTAAPVGLCYLDRELRFVSINERLAALHGLSVEEHIGRTAQEVVPDLFVKMEPYLRGALAGHSYQDEDVIGVAPGGREVTAHETFEPAFDRSGNVVGISITVTDLSPYKRDEAALLESARHYEEVRRDHPENVWQMTGDGLMTATSDHWRRISGLSIAASRNFGWIQAIHPDDVANAMSALRNALYFGKPIDIRYRLRTRGGEWVQVQSKAAPVFDATGLIDRWNGSSEFGERTDDAGAAANRDAENAPASELQSPRDT